MSVAKNKPASFLRFKREDIVQYFSIVTIIILVAAFQILRGNFLGKTNLTNLLRDTAPLLIMSAGMCSVLIFGSIDLSEGAICSVCNILFVRWLNDHSSGSVLGTTIVAVLVTVAFGMFAGFLLGVVHVKLKVPSFIASLGFMSVWQSVAYLVSSAPISVPKAMWGAVNWFKVSFGVVGLPLVIAVILAAVLYVFQSRMSFGRAMFAIGGNERAARIAGLGVDRTKIIVFTINGVCAALGGIFLAAKGRSGSPTAGADFTLLIVASCVLGGTSLSGGKGNALGTIIGVFTVALIRNGMNFIGVSAYWQDVVFGLFVLAAIAMSVDRSHRALAVK